MSDGAQSLYPEQLDKLDDAAASAGAGRGQELSLIP